MLNLQHFTRTKDYIPGFLAVLFIAVFSCYISKFHEAFDALVISIVIGMLLGNSIGGRDYFEKGIDGAIKVFLPAGIALYGTQLVFNDLKLGFILISTEGLLCSLLPDFQSAEPLRLLWYHLL
jgi:uncharacterized membrane protein YadS